MGVSPEAGSWVIHYRHLSGFHSRDAGKCSQKLPRSCRFHCTEEHGDFPVMNPVCQCYDHLSFAGLEQKYFMSDLAAFSISVFVPTFLWNVGATSRNIKICSKNQSPLLASVHRCFLWFVWSLPIGKAVLSLTGLPAGASTALNWTGTGDSLHVCSAAFTGDVSLHCGGAHSFTPVSSHHRIWALATDLCCAT